MIDDPKKMPPDYERLVRFAEALPPRVPCRDADEVEARLRASVAEAHALAARHMEERESAVPVEVHDDEQPVGARVGIDAVSGETWVMGGGR